MDQTFITVLRYSITYYQKDLFICAQYANKHKATALHKAYWLPCLCVKLQYLVSTYLQLDCLYLKKQIYSETFCYPTPHVKLQSILTKVQFSHI